jgi:hypothetical protein
MGGCRKESTTIRNPLAHARGYHADGILLIVRRNVAPRVSKGIIFQSALRNRVVDIVPPT